MPVFSLKMVGFSRSEPIPNRNNVENTNVNKARTPLGIPKNTDFLALSGIFTNIENDSCNLRLFSRS